MMAEFAGLDDADWGLQAIVGGSNSGFCSDFTATAISAGADSCYGVVDVPKDAHHDLLISFPDLFHTAAMLTDELEELYKPFYPISNSSSPAENVPFTPISVPNETKEEPEEVGEKRINLLDLPAVNSSASSYAPKYKRRKNQQKKVVLQVTAEDLSSDMWAWRKYGQKPIKGSPYPRSYYKCSSSKGCLARKQVEQSYKDPGTFIITYTAEHSHSQPTRKNALAGTTRHKFPGPKNLVRSNTIAAKSEDTGASCSPTSSTDVLSPGTPLIPSVENESPQRNIKQESNDEIMGEQIIDVGDGNNMVISGIKLDDDFFSGLEDLDGLISEFANYGHYSTEQFSCELF